MTNLGTSPNLTNRYHTSSSARCDTTAMRVRVERSSRVFMAQGRGRRADDSGASRGQCSPRRATPLLDSLRPAVRPCSGDVMPLFHRLALVVGALAASVAAAPAFAETKVDFIL